ncbi:MAG: GtrA family protein [Bacteroidota bacterium]
MLTDILSKFIRFAAVGASGVIIDFGITGVLKEKLGAHKYLANSIGFVTAASSNYVLNRIWTFASTNPQIALEYSKFLGVSLAGLAINNSLLWYFHQRRGINFYWAKAIAIVLTTAWNFSFNFLFTFVTS